MFINMKFNVEQKILCKYLQLRLECSGNQTIVNPGSLTFSYIFDTGCNSFEMWAKFVSLTMSARQSLKLDRLAGR